MDRYLELLSNELDVAIGTTTVGLDSRRGVVRGGEAAIANLITDAHAGGHRRRRRVDQRRAGIRGDKVYPPGTTLLRRDLRTELPFGNRTIVLELTGADLRAALENGVSAVAEGSGRFPHVSGMT